MTIKSFQDLEVWRISMDLAEDIYQLVRQFPVEERYVLSAQLRRAGVSIPSNIAEGYGFGTTGRYVQHLRVASGSDAELQTQLLLSTRLEFAKLDEVMPILERASRVGRMLNGLIHSLEPYRDKS
jgi:four helix bundle protein